MKEKFKELIENYFDFKRDDFLEQIEQIIKTEKTLKDDLSTILLEKSSPLYLKELILTIIKKSGDSSFLNILQKFINQCSNKRLKQIAINSLSGIKDYKTERILFELKASLGEELKKDIENSLNILYGDKKIRMLRSILSERKDRVLFVKAVDYFKKNRDKEILKYILPLIIEEDELIRNEIISLLLTFDDIDKKSFKFLSVIIKKLFFKGINFSYLKKIIYLLSSLSVKNKKSELIKFYKELEKEAGDNFEPLKPYAFVPFREKKYKSFYITLFEAGNSEEKLITLKNLPEEKDAWVKDILKEAIESRNIQYSEEAFKKILKIGYVNDFYEEIVKLPLQLKLTFLKIALKNNHTMPHSLIEKLVEEEDESIIELLLEYMFLKGGEKAETFFKGIIKKNFKIEIKKDAIKYLTKSSKDRTSLLNFYKELIFSHIKGKDEKLYLYIVSSLKTILKNEDIENIRKTYINLIFTIFEKSLSEQLLLSILSTLQDFPFKNDKELNFVREEFLDKKKELLNIKEDMSPILRYMSDVEKKIEKRVSLNKKREKVRESFLKELLSLRENKERIINISNILKEYPELPSEKEKSFLKEYCKSEIINPFNKRIIKISLLEIISTLNFEDLKETLLNLYKQNPVDLKTSLKNTMLKIGVTEKEIKANEISRGKI